jgi:poly-beta-1,6-N-acetyl-D-glucosamine N-deacetylase
MTASSRVRRLGAVLLLALSGSVALAALPDTDAQGRTRVEGKSKRALFPRFDGAVPVLLYHRLAPSNGGYSVAPAAFEAQLRRLRELGFEAITLDLYVRFIRGDAVDLPRRPILITFDDAHGSAWANADHLLERYGWSAVMYVPTGAVGQPGRLTWETLRQMRSSGRWEIEEHAGDGHVLITAGPGNRKLPFYAAEQWRAGKQESFPRYKGRVSGDIEHGSAMLAQNLPGWKPNLSFAVPFNNYGQNGSNDPRIKRWLSGYLKNRFAVVFVQRDDSYTTPGPGFGNRITVSSHWDAGTLETRLRRGLHALNAPGDDRR